MAIADIFGDPNAFLGYDRGSFRDLRAQSALRTAGQENDLQLSLLKGKSDIQFDNAQRMLGLLGLEGGFLQSLLGGVSGGGDNSGLFGQIDQFAKRRVSDINSQFGNSVQQAEASLQDRGLVGSNLLGVTAGSMEAPKQQAITGALGQALDTKVGLAEQQQRLQFSLLQSLLGGIF